MLLKRLGLHYIGLQKSAAESKPLIAIKPQKIASIQQIVTNFG
jgi:hypothetical protein